MNNPVSQPITTPKMLRSLLPVPQSSTVAVEQSRSEIKDILSGKDDRLMLVVGPCSIHDTAGALEYAYRLNALRLLTRDRLHIIMRVYFEKPRTVLGWKGLIMDPHLDGSYDIELGLRTARSLLVEITSLGLGTGMEMLDPIFMEYMSDLVSWVSIGARTTESQIHRQSASGSRIPVGFKNGTDGSLESAVHAIKAAASSHCFPGIDSEGRVCLVRTEGNPYGHLILRGGKAGPNYDQASSLQAKKALDDAKCGESCVIDCSHQNSGKDYLRQIEVLKEIVKRRKGEGERHLKGLMLESNLFDGNQSLIPGQTLKYGVSVTDPCLGWEKTEELIRWAYENA